MQIPAIVQSITLARCVGVLFPALLPFVASGATYFVDSKNGNDSWSGTASTPDGRANGPWKTLSRVNQASLAAGDEVRLACGQAWLETLAPSGNGSEGVPITIGAYPTDCTDKPTIGGLTTIPAAAWERDGDNVWRARLPANRITNGSLAGKLDGWRTWPTPQTSLSAVAECPDRTTPCALFNGGTPTNNYIGTRGFQVEANVTYRITLQWYGTPRSLIEPVVRQQLAPYWPLGLFGKTLRGEDKWSTTTLEFKASQSYARAALQLHHRGDPIYLRNVVIERLGGTEPIVSAQESSSLSFWRAWPLPQARATEVACPRLSGQCTLYESGSQENKYIASPAFAIAAGQRYTLRFAFRAEPTTKIFPTVRNPRAPYQTLGLDGVTLTGNGQWQAVSQSFTASADFDGAIVGIYHQGAAHVYFADVSLARDDDPSNVMSVFENGRLLAVAHHPNKGHDPAKPDSPFLATTSASSSVRQSDGSYASTELVTGDMKLPAGRAIEIGDTVRIRTHNWIIDERKISAIDGKRLSLDTPTKYALKYKGQGYYFVGKKWMLDSEGEWYADPATRTLYAWPPGGEAPESRISIASTDVGLDLNKRTHYVIDSLRIVGVRQAAIVSGSRNVTLKNIVIEDVVDDAVYANGAANLTISDSSIRRVQGNSVLGWHSDDMVVERSTFEESGFIGQSPEEEAGLPQLSYGAVTAGKRAQIRDNVIRRTGYHAITVEEGSTVTGNRIFDICLVLNDCGGVYFNNTVGGAVSGNIMVNGKGDLRGLPTPPYRAIAAGLFADGGARVITFSDNLVTGMDYGALFHDASSLTVSGNTLYGNRIFQIWLLENNATLRPAGNIHENLIVGNTLFATGANPALRFSANQVVGTDDFGQFRNNVHSELSNGIVASIQERSSAQAYTFAQWQAIADNGVSRNYDADGRLVAPLAGFAPGRMGPALLTNGTFANSSAGWIRWNSSGDKPSIATSACGPDASNCMTFTAAGTGSSFSSPNFTVYPGKRYRVVMDSRSDQGPQSISVIVRRDGDSASPPVQRLANTMSISANWRRIAFIFKAEGGAVPDAGKGVKGAALNFGPVPDGVSLQLANVEVNQIDDDGLGDDPISHLLVNSDGAAQTYECPDEETLPARCAMYVDAHTGQGVVWPVSLEPGQHAIVFAQRLDLPDSDNDGIADAQDLCAATSSGEVANSKGCSLN